MAVEVLMPSLGMARESGRLVRWLKREGDRVARGERLLEVEADMKLIDVESPGAGVLSGVRFREGEEVRVGAVMAYLLAPAVRPAPGPAPPAERAPSPLWRQTLSLVLFREVDVSQLIVARTKQPPPVTDADLMLRLVAATLAGHPLINSGRGEVNVAFSVAGDEGMALPVIHRADRLDAAGLAARRAELVERAQAGRLRARDLADATFTISDVGPYGADACLPVVPEGQAAILGVGRVIDRVVPVRGRPQLRPTLALALACDPAIDSARAGRFLVELAEAIEEPADSL